MKDMLDLKHILHCGHFSCFRPLLKGGAKGTGAETITAKTYRMYVLQPLEMDTIHKSLKLTEIQVDIN